MPPYFSVITPSYNQGEYIGACLQSVRDQEDPDFEHLVLDNCSTDSTEAEVAKFPKAIFVCEPDRGQSDAVNKGFRMATGEIICWLNSDDAYPRGLFRRLREYFSDPRCEVVFGDVDQVAYDGSAPQRAAACFKQREDLVRWWSSRARLHQPAVFFRRSLREKIGFLREDLHFAMDYEYWWRMSAAAPFSYRPEILAVQHRQPESKTVKAWQSVYEEREKIFSRYYGLIDGGDPRGLEREKRKAMASRYLTEAFCAAPDGAALSLLLRSFRSWPPGMLDLRWLGVIRRLVSGSRTPAGLLER